MKVFFAISTAAMLAVCCSAFGQVKLRARSSGLPDSVVSYSQKILENGSKFLSLTMDFSGQDGRSVKVRTERTYASDGSPIRIFQETVSQKPSFRNSTTVTFTDEGAHVVLDERGKRTVKDIPLVATAPRKCVSEFWFLRDQPKPGQTVKYYHFDATKLEWQISQSTFVGPKKVKIGNTVLNGNLVRLPEGEAILDEKGLPIQLTFGAVSMIRI